ncbi:hypothetical protein QE152_g34166 [Popillia japonica]|uniref:Double jelly roll-like domain-containing protein n=1 Tax=Popillia japonica TaxID=7064 RepID=A0AAW1ITV2_POPJA
MDILDVQRKVRLDNSITSDESKNSVTASLIHNAGAYMFSHIRYIISGVKVDEVRNVGIASTMKGYFSYSPSYINKLENCGWDVGTGKALIMDSKGNFNICIPLKMLMGFAEDVKQILMNVPQELVLKRCADDSDVIYNSVTTEEVKLIITNIVWRVPHVKVGISRELALTKLTTQFNDTEQGKGRCSENQHQNEDVAALAKAGKDVCGQNVCGQLQTPPDLPRSMPDLYYDIAGINFTPQDGPNVDNVRNDQLLWEDNCLSPQQLETTTAVATLHTIPQLAPVITPHQRDRTPDAPKPTGGRAVGPAVRPVGGRRSACAT